MSNKIRPVKSRKTALVRRISPDLETSIGGIDVSMVGYLQNLGLPTENILYPISERSKVINSLSSAIEALPIDERAKADYITKFTVAVAVGLFDGAVNYLWNETILALRNLVVSFDLQYFFSIVERNNSRLKRLNDKDDLTLVSDHELLDTCRLIGLMSDVDFKRLELINYMRNHASAAHPNEIVVSGLELLAWLDTCIRHAIKAAPDHSVISIKKLLDNIRAVNIPSADATSIGNEVSRHSQEQIDGLLATVFGMFTDVKVQEIPKDNIRLLAPCIWQYSSEDRKFEIGARFGVFRKQGDVPRKELADEFLKVVNGERYKDEDSLAGELLEKLQELKRVHYSANNFYDEYAHAFDLKEAVPTTGVVPQAAISSWVKVISICYVGNGKGYWEGVDKAAERYYKDFIKQFSETAIIEFIKLFQDVEFTSTLHLLKPDERVRAEAEILLDRIKNVHINRVLQLIINFPKRTLDRVASVSEFKRELSVITSV